MGKGFYQPEDISSSCTHIMYGFAKIEEGAGNAGYEIAPYEWNDILSYRGMYSRVQEKAQSFGAKVMLSLGGWNVSCVEKERKKETEREREREMETHTPTPPTSSISARTFRVRATASPRWHQRQQAVRPLSTTASPFFERTTSTASTSTGSTQPR